MTRGDGLSRKLCDVTATLVILTAVGRPVLLTGGGEMMQPRDVTFQIVWARQPREGTSVFLGGRRGRHQRFSLRARRPRFGCRVHAGHMTDQTVLAQEQSAARVARERTAFLVHDRVRRQAGLARKRLVAHRARERPLAGVRAPVCVEAVTAHERLVTLIATVSVLAGVLDHVRGQVVLIRVRAAAHRAHERPLARMHAPVRGQHVDAGERLVAHRTLVRPLARVRSNVHRQVVLSREPLVALDAFVRPVTRMRQRVLGQRAVRREPPLTHGARVPPPVVVHFLVPDHVTAFSERFRTRSARVSFSVRWSDHIHVVTIGRGSLAIVVVGHGSLTIVVVWLVHHRLLRIRPFVFPETNYPRQIIILELSDTSRKRPIDKPLQ